MQVTQGNAVESLCGIQCFIDEPAEDARPSSRSHSLGRVWISPSRRSNRS
jgi:hypothetical protein